MFEREISRSKILEARVEEMKLKRRTMLQAEEDRIRREQEVKTALELDPDNPDQFVMMIEGDEQFRTAISDFQDTILAVERKRSKRQVTMERTVFELVEAAEELLKGPATVYAPPSDGPASEPREQQSPGGGGSRRTSAQAQGPTKASPEA